MTTFLIRLNLTALLVLTVSICQAAPIPVVSYTPNVAPNASYPDTGGVELTDATTDVNVWPTPGDTTPLVGWNSPTNPSLTFSFTSPTQLGSMVVYFADSNGSSGVGYPASVTVTDTGAYSQLYPVSDPAGSGTTVPVTFNLFGHTASSVNVDVVRAHEWTMISEVQFFAPEDAATIDGNNKVQDVEYRYNDLTIGYKAINGKDNNAAPFGAPQSLTDGFGLAGLYTPGGSFWGAGEEGTIYERFDGDISNGEPQPSVTFDLGGLVDLDNMVIHYGLHDNSAVKNPTSVDVYLDGAFVGTYGGFTDSSTVANNTIDSLEISLLGQSGQYVRLDFQGTDSVRAASAWLGLTEVEFFATVVPEPNTYLLVLTGVGIVLVAYRRRRRG